MAKISFDDILGDYNQGADHIEYVEADHPGEFMIDESPPELELVELYEDQKRAMDQMKDFLDSDADFHILLGWAGTGKSFTLKEFGKMAKAKGYNVYYTATTNKAAKVIRKMNPTDEASTIHSLMKLRLKDDYTTGKQVLVSSGRYDAKDENSKTELEYPYVICCDEVSMMNRELFEHLRDTVRGKVLLIGDDKQLPPVGEDESPVFNMGINTSVLDVVKRQSLDNPILALATAFREGMSTRIVPNVIQSINPDNPTKGIRVVPRGEFKSLMVSAFSSNKYKEDEEGDYAKVLGWRNKTVISYNRLIRKHSFGFESDQPVPGEVYICNTAIVKTVMNEEGVESDTVVLKNEDTVTIIKSEAVDHRGVHCFKLQVEEYAGDLYMIQDQDQYKLQKENLAKVAKGIGFEVEGMEKQGAGQYAIAQKKKERSKAWFEFFNISKELSDIRPQYAVTIHKSQGSTYQVAFIDYGDIMVNRNFNEMMRLMYVSITRAKIQVVITF